MKRIAPGFVALCLLGLAGPATAATLKVAPEPAATLLLPYFAVDYSSTDGSGQNTLFSINNASDQPVLAHVVVWSDLSVPVLGFNIYLTGYDVQTLNLWNLLRNGLLPSTASAGQDPSDTISPKGSFSQDIDFPSCNGLLPPPTLPADFVAHLQASLSGRASTVFGGLCAGRNLGDNVARGYVTVDTVNNCTLRFPGDSGYFAADGSGDATNQNVLWGDYFYINSAANLAEANTLVHILFEEPPPPSSVSFSAPYTFYGRYVSWSGADKRHPLATSFGVRFLNGGPFSGGTDLIVWRDSKTNQGPFTCPAQSGRPSWFPLSQEGIVVFDEQEHPYVPQNPFSPFPAEAQSVNVGGANFPVPFSFGWVYLNLNNTVFTETGPPNTAQAWVTVKMTSQGRFSVGFDAIQIDNASRPRHQTPGPP
ncbi:MAG: hypothetical protein ACJ76Y_06620 [Thermoanaerobaculia bacterium]